MKQMLVLVLHAEKQVCLPQMGVNITSCKGFNRNDFSMTQIILCKIKDAIIQV